MAVGVSGGLYVLVFVLLILSSAFLAPAFVPGLVLTIVGHASPAKGLQKPGKILLILGIIGLALCTVLGVVMGVIGASAAASGLAVLF